MAVEIGANDFVFVGIALVPQKKQLAGIVAAELAQEVGPRTFFLGCRAR